MRPQSRTPSDEELKQTIVDVDFQQYHELKRQLYPRTSSVLRLHPDGMHHKTHFGNCSAAFLEYVEYSAQQGVHVHNAARRLLTHELLSGKIPYEGFDSADVTREPGESAPLSQAASRKVDRFQQWYAEQKPVLLHPPEKTLVSPVLDFGGTLDLALRIRQTNYVVDIKIGKRTHDVNWLQVRSYAELLRREAGIIVDKIAILLLGAPNKSGVRFVVRDLHDDHREQFYRLLDKWYELFPEPFPPRDTSQHVTQEF